MAGPFEGVRVLDVSQGLSGPLAAMLLADFGAEVLKVESPAGDRLKHSAGYVGWNRNKHRLTLDIKVADGRARLDALIGGADLVVLDHGPAELARLGIDLQALADQVPGLVLLWLPPYGVCGRWSELAPHHAILTGLSGAAFRQGAWRDQPIWHVTPIVHYAQATLGAAAAAAALYERSRTHAGRRVTVSGLHALSQVACPVTPLGLEDLGRGSPIGSSPSYRLYPCGDGQWLFLGTLFPHFFSRAVEALEIGAGELQDPGQAIGARLASRPRAHWLALFRAHDVPAGPVEPRRSWLSSGVVQANDLAAQMIHQTHGKVTMPGVSARLSATPGAVRHLLSEAQPEWCATFATPRPRPAPLGRRQGAAPLAGVKVLDLGTVIAGAYAGAILANLGAEVVKIEPPEGDPFRFAMTGFINCNRGKRGLGLDLKHPEGRRLFLDLARTADVVLDNYRLGVRERLGIAYPALRQVNPRLISCSANTYGARGPDAARPGFDPLIQAQSGLMSAQGGEGNEPVFHTIPVNDVAAAALTAFAIIAALDAREVSGEGQEVETSLAGAATLYQFGELVDFKDRPPNRDGDRDCLGVAALERFYPCRDGWLTLAAADPAGFQAVAGVLGLDGWTADQAVRAPRDGPLALAIAAALAGWNRDEAVDALLRAGVAAAPVHRPGEALACETLWENRYFEIQDHPQWGELVGSRGFAAFDGLDCAFTRPDPGLGEHGLEVLTDYGIPRARIIELARGGVIFRGQ